MNSMSTDMQDKKARKQANIQRLLLAQNAQISISEMAGEVIKSEQRHLSNTRAIFRSASGTDDCELDDDDEEDVVVYRSLNAKTAATTQSTMRSFSIVDTPDAVQQEQKTVEERVGIALELLKEEPPNDDEASARFQLVTKQIDTIDGLLKTLPSDSTFKFDHTADNIVAEQVGVWVGHGMAVKAMENVAKLNKHIEDSMPTSFECAICFDEDLKLPEDQVTTLQCTHKFCKDCFGDWAKSCRVSRPWMSNGCVTCPLCRATVSDADVPVVARPAFQPAFYDDDEEDYIPVYRTPYNAMMEHGARYASLTNNPIDDMEPVVYRSGVFMPKESNDDEDETPFYASLSFINGTLRNF